MSQQDGSAPQSHVRCRYAKHTNFDVAVHVPLMMRAPWKPQSQGKHTTSYTELLDLYRTIADVSGLGTEAVQSDVAGTSVAPLLDDPSHDLKNIAFAQYSRCPGMRQWPKITPDAPGWFMNNCEGESSRVRV